MPHFIKLNRNRSGQFSPIYHNVDHIWIIERASGVTIKKDEEDIHIPTCNILDAHDFNPIGVSTVYNVEGKAGDLVRAIHEASLGIGCSCCCEESEDEETTKKE